MVLEVVLAIDGGRQEQFKGQITMSYNSNGNELSTGVFGGKMPHVDLGHESSSVVNPLGELMRAMVLRVVDDVRAGGELRDDALAYMDEAPDDESGDDYVLSFRNVAAYLGVCPQRLRAAIIDPERSISTRRRAA